MAKINLRAYIREIEEMVDNGNYAETITHSRYILERFPKHVISYRLLGKALLENRRYSDAADIFQRVLSSLPDDFIAHLGMSIIREEEGNLDAAIWHMERAFEVQPSNAAVQVELRRLYGRRDGQTPPKVHLTRGALARMSAKSRLYSQAITELRAALSEDPQRPDLQVLLASLYASSGQRVAAVETCNVLLNKYPYCLEANRILAEILPSTERASEAQIYRKRLEELDPYAAFLSPTTPTLEQVDDDAVTLERFEYAGSQAVGLPAQPAAVTPSGVPVEGSTSSQESLPEWLISIAEEGKSDEPALDLSMESGELKLESEDQIPETQFAELESTMEPGAIQPEPSLVEPPPEDIPDWLKDLEAAVPEGADETEGFMADQQVEPTATKIPTWLHEIEEEPPSVSEAPQVPPLSLEAEEAEIRSGEIPETLVAGFVAGEIKREHEKADLSALPPTEVPLEGDTQPVRVEIEPITPPLVQAEIIAEAVSSKESPTLEEIPPEISPIPSVLPEESEVIQPTSAEEEASVIAWLDNFAAQEAPESEILITSQEPIVETPEVEEQVTQIAGEVPEEPIIMEQELEGEIQISEEVHPAEPVAIPEAETEIPEWLREFTEEPSPVEMEETPTWSPPAVTAEEIPEPIEAGPLDTGVVEISPETVPVAPSSTQTQLMQAWHNLTSGDLPTAIDQYSQMIRSGQDLDLVVMHLQEALLFHPDDPSVHQALGDAYLRTDQLQEALDAYTKAEELL